MRAEDLATYAARNVLIHDYRRLIQGLTWRVVAEALPTLAGRVRAITSAPEGDGK